MNENRKLRALALTQQNVIESTRENLMSLNFYDVDTVSGKLSFNILWGDREVMCFHDITHETTKISYQDSSYNHRSTALNGLLTSMGIPQGSIVRLICGNNGSIIIEGEPYVHVYEYDSLTISDGMCLSIFIKVIDVVKPDIRGKSVKK